MSLSELALIRQLRADCAGDPWLDSLNDGEDGAISLGDGARVISARALRPRGFGLRGGGEDVSHEYS